MSKSQKLTPGPVDFSRHNRPLLPLKRPICQEEETRVKVEHPHEQIRGMQQIFAFLDHGAQLFDRTLLGVLPQRVKVRRWSPVWFRDGVWVKGGSCGLSWWRRTFPLLDALDQVLGRGQTVLVALVAAAGTGELGTLIAGNRLSAVDVLAL